MAKLNANVAMYQKQAPIALMQCSSCQNFKAGGKGKVNSCATVDVVPASTGSCVVFMPKLPLPVPPLPPLLPAPGLTTGTEAWNTKNIRANIF